MHLQALPFEQDSRQTVWSSAFRRLRWQIVTSSRGPAKAGTPNSVHPRTKNHAQRVVKPRHDSAVYEMVLTDPCLP
jgi:hypothetical protein